MVLTLSGHGQVVRQSSGNHLGRRDHPDHRRHECPQQHHTAGAPLRDAHVPSVSPTYGGGEAVSDDKVIN
eukprot:13208811-Alexandrium_andersonii.AAC.1